VAQADLITRRSKSGGQAELGVPAYGSRWYPTPTVEGVYEARLNRRYGPSKLATMARVQRFFLYDEGEPKIEDLLKLSSEQVLRIVAYVDEHGFSGSPQELLDLAGGLGISYEKTADLVQYCGYLQAERARLGLDLDGLIAEFDVYLERSGLRPEEGAKLTELSEPLKRLFADRPRVALRDKVASVTAGVVPQGIDFRSICDLRPIFDEKRETILEYAIVALVRVLLKSETLENSTVFFQIDSQGVGKLEEFLGRLRKKMDALEKVRSGLLGEKK
jgi:hypothetical protein